MTFHVGQRVAIAGTRHVSTGGCLVRFTNQPARVLLLGAGHGLVGANARPGDPVIDFDSGITIGKLLTWTTFRDDITADAALVWVDRKRVSAASVAGVKAGQPGAALSAGAPLTMIGPSAGNIRTGVVGQLDADVALSPSGVGWGPVPVVYSHQILSQEMFSQDGDSGAIVLDKSGGTAGMVVAAQPAVFDGNNWVSRTIITPIAGILGHPDFGGRTLEILSEMPDSAEAPSGLP